MDFVSQGNFVEAPDAVADQAYLGIAPTTVEKIGAEFDKWSPIRTLTDAAERGSQAGASFFDRGLALTGEANAGMVVSQPQQSPTLPAAEINKRYAPEGTTITDKPMAEGLAQIVGREKQDQTNRDSVIARYRNTHSWLANFGTGLAGFILDPLNDATMFVPGLGEDAILGGLAKAGLGTGLVARTIARAGAGATAGAAGQVPLSALRYGLAPEEATDYDLRDAASDVLFGAAGGAALGAGLGLGLHESGLLGHDTAMQAAAELGRPRPPSPVDTALAVKTDPATNHVAMSSAVSQLIDGRPVDVLPVFDAKDFEQVAQLGAMRAEHAGLVDRIAALPAGDAAAAERLTRLEAVENSLKDETLSPETRRAALTRRDELLADTTPEMLKAAAAPLVDRQRLTAMQARLGDEIGRLERVRESASIDAALAPNGQQAPLRFSPGQLAETQAALYRAGYVHGISANDLATAKQDIYGPKEQPAASVPGSGAHTAEDKSPAENDLFELERRWAAASDEGSRTFTTAKGSTYELHDDNTTTRNKAYRPEHGEAEQGPQPRSQRTYYVTKEHADQLGLFQTQDGPRMAVAETADGRLGVKYLDGKDAGKFEKRTVAPGAKEPAPGLVPVEIWKDGTRVHFGNEITAVQQGTHMNLRPEETDELADTQKALGDAQKKEQGFGQASECVKGAGI